MAPERDDRIAKLFAECLEMPSEERAAFLGRHCAGDSGLREEIESLLRFHDESGDFLEEMDRAKAAALVDSGPDPLPRKAIGAYRLIREIGRGGMGVVYLAERADGQFDQKVALKLVKRGMDSDEILRRFLLERQILARLQHPNIAALLDGGVTDDGQPWFAMEHVDGLPLIEYCDHHRLDIGARLRLFEDVGRAVGNAHQSLVVHRDLKPSNILVTSDGQVKLLDFGIARLLDTASGTPGSTLTEAGLRLVTPEYGSPEQLRGEPAATSTDIYAMGVILYELLTGRRPFTFEERTPEALARLAGTTEAVKPSVAIARDKDRDTADDLAAARGTTLPRLKRHLQGDLDTIILKALRKEPERRYSSVEAFLEDLGRYQSGLPVRARPDTFAYRSLKFLRRNGLAAAAVVLVILSLAGGLAVALWQRGLALTEAAKAREVQDFLMETFQVSDPWRTKGEEVTARELLDKGAARIAEGLSGQPEVQGRMMSVIGTLYQRLGIYDRAVAQFEGALDLRTRTLGPNHLDVAESQKELAVALIDGADYARGEELVRQAIQTRRNLAGDDTETGIMLNTLGWIEAEMGKYQDAEAHLREALSIHRRTVGNEHEATIASLNNLGLALRWGGQIEEAEAIHREALDLNRKVFGNDHPQTAWALERFGVGLAQKGDTVAAEPLLQEGLDILVRVLGEDHPDVALAQNNLAKTLMVGGNPDAAEPLFRSALAINARVHGKESLYVTTNLANLAEVLIAEERSAEAVPLLERAVDLRRRHLDDDHPEVARVLHRLAFALMLEGDLAKAESLYVEALVKARAGWDAGHPELATLLAGYGELKMMQGLDAEAEPLLRESLAIRQKVLVEGHWERDEVAALLGECLLNLNRRDEAGPLLREGHQHLDAKRGPDDRATQRAARALGRLNAP